MCFLLPTFFSRDLRIGNHGLHLFPVHHCQQEMRFQHCLFLIARKSFGQFLSGKALFQFDLKIMTLFKAEVGVKWI